MSSAFCTEPQDTSQDKSPCHPDQNLPGCMMPDGGQCCAGHAAVCDDWHKQQRRIEQLKAALNIAIDVFEGMNDDEINEELLPDIRKALA